jgi:hypothetical protein
MSEVGTPRYQFILVSIEMRLCLETDVRTSIPILETSGLCKICGDSILHLSWRCSSVSSRGAHCAILSVFTAHHARPLLEQFQGCANHIAE